MPIPLTGAQYEIVAGDYAADLLPPAGAGQLLAPWPNRVDRGRYSFDGAELQLDLSEPAAGNAIHGLTRWATWVPVTFEPNSVLLRQLVLGHAGYPFCLEIDAEYRVDRHRGLRGQGTARNQGSGPAPYGTGSHPYLTAGTPTVDDCELTLPAARWQPTDDRGIPH